MNKNELDTKIDFPELEAVRPASSVDTRPINTDGVAINRIDIYTYKNDRRQLVSIASVEVYTADRTIMTIIGQDWRSRLLCEPCSRVSKAKVAEQHARATGDDMVMHIKRVALEHYKALARDMAA